MSEIKYTHSNQRHNPKDALEILPFVFKIFSCSSVLDVGTGNGSWLAAAKQLGKKEVMGIDGIKVDDSDLLINNKEFLQYDLSKPFRLSKKFDLVLSLEVAEHLPESSAEAFIKSLCDHGDVVLFSAAIPGQGGDHHINEQWPKYWVEKFMDNGFLPYDVLREKFWNNKEVFWWYRQNMVLFARKGQQFKLELKPSKGVLSLVHPELFSKKIFRPKHMNWSELYVLFKMLVKASLNKLKF